MQKQFVEVGRIVDKGRKLWFHCLIQFWISRSRPLRIRATVSHGIFGARPINREMLAPESQDYKIEAEKPVKFDSKLQL